MMLVMLAALLLQAVPAFVPPPAPPAPASDDAAAERIAEHYRERCMSEAGIVVAVAGWRQWMAGGAPRLARQKAVDNDLATAALTSPIDISRLNRALAAKRREQSDYFEAQDANSLAILDRLSPADRVAYARGLTIMSPVVPARRCPTHQAG